MTYAHINRYYMKKAQSPIMIICHYYHYSDKQRQKLLLEIKNTKYVS